MAEPVKYVSKPQEVEVMLFDGSESRAHAIIGWMLSTGQPAEPYDHYGALLIELEMGDHSVYAHPGEYIVKVSENEFEFYSPENFAKYYDKKEPNG